MDTSSMSLWKGKASGSSPRISAALILRLQTRPPYSLLLTTLQQFPLNVPARSDFKCDGSIWGQAHVFSASSSVIPLPDSHFPSSIYVTTLSVGAHSKSFSLKPTFKLEIWHALLAVWVLLCVVIVIFFFSCPINYFVMELEWPGRLRNVPALLFL